jgi:hypothetical protein
MEINLEYKKPQKALKLLIRHRPITIKDNGEEIVYVK